MVVSRARFLRRSFGVRRTAVRPPWSHDEAAFVERCTRCDDCIGACPTRILIRGSGGFPEVDFSRGACTFCAECVRVCAPRALYGTPGVPPWRAKARLTDACLAYRAVVCRSCGEACEKDAISFRLHRGGILVPQLDDRHCDGCGACVAVCPSSAIRVEETRAAAENNRWTSPA